MGFHWNEDMYGIIRVEKVYHSGSITVIESRFSHLFCTVFITDALCCTPEPQRYKSTMLLLSLSRFSRIRLCATP